MSGVLAGQVGQVAANTAFVAKSEELFGRSKDALYGIFTDVVPCDGQYLEADAYGPPPAVEKIVGSRKWASIRAYARRVPVARYGPPGIERPSLAVQKDKSGLETQFLTSYLQRVSNFFEKPATDLLLTNPTGIDGVALLSNSHPYAYGGSTWDNLSGNALSASEFATAISAISGLRLENGEPAGFFPTHLMVGPALRKLANDLCENTMRVVPVDAGGVEAYASAVAATAIPNTWMGASIQPIINPRFADGTHDNDWILMDLRPGSRPIMLGEAVAPMAVVVDDPQSEPMRQRSSFGYFVEGQAALTGFCPFGMYGKIS